LNAILDTGADISFINPNILNDFNFESFIESRDNRTQQSYKGYLRIENLVNSHELTFGVRSLPNSNPNEKEPDMLLGRDFLQHTNLYFYGGKLKINLEWIE
jgi:hypothetical protein